MNEMQRCKTILLPSYNHSHIGENVTDIYLGP